MADIPCGDKILDYLVLPALKKLLHPIFCFQSIVDDFQDQNKKLSAIQERVENEVQRDRHNARVINNSVDEWLKAVNASMAQVQHVESGLEKNKSCFRYSWCPNWTCHYKFSKQVSEITATMKTLCANGDLFSSVSHPPTLHQDITGSSSSADFMHSLSSKSAFDQIMEALKRDDINLIGLYGGVGAGKTTIAEQVSLEAKAIFHHVIMVHVSPKPDVRRVQGLIADFLNLSLEQLESDQARATTLQMRLKNGDYILIILDDVWKDFDLGAVGIPTVGCKLLLTAHAKVQVPNSMHTQRDVVLCTLSEDEAWTLFESIACVGDEVRKHGVAKDALAECHGLPKAIVAIGTALNGKDVSVWTETLQKLKKARFEIIDSLKKDVEKLSLKQDRVNSNIKKAKENVHEIYSDVEKWLKDVERVMNDVEQFDNELNQNKWCFDDRDVAKKVEAFEISVKNLFAEGNFEQVSHPTPLVQDMRLLSSQDYMFSKSAESALSQIVEALKADGVKMIGMYGMGGIGKTTLANQVQNEVVRQNIFDHSIMVTVSQKPDVGNMQDKIAEVLGFDELKYINTLDGRAHKLCERLENEKILIILDDVWKPFHMRTIGMPLNSCKSCKVLVTSRRRDICSSMNCQPEIQLNLLSGDESQNFFKTKAGLSREFGLDDVAKQIVEECKCLPIALETVGAALKNKGKDEWTEALEKLRNAKLVDIMGVDDDDKNAYKCVKVSYDYLKSSTQTQQAQFILLLCSIFPEDYKIEVEDLARYAFGMELFERVSSIEDARRKLRVTIRFLKDSCLLSDIGDEEYVQMHDVVRDTVLWIGRTETEGRKVLTVRDNRDLKELIRKKSFQDCRAVSFTSDVIPKLSKYNKLECPNLEAVLIFSKGEDVELREGFFEDMQLLKVLDIKGGEGWTKCKFAMPQSLHRLEFLRTLMLRYCECSNSSILRELRKLKILSLIGCEIDGGVDIVSGLKKLRLLDLSEVKAETRMFTSNVIECFNKLEELHGYTFSECEDEEGIGSSLSELMLLSNLVALSVEVEDERCLPKNFNFPNVQSYYIRVGVDMSWSSIWVKRARESRRLELIGITGGESVWISACKKLLPIVKDLLFKHCHALFSLDAFNSHAEGFLQRLESLEVEECNIMEWIFEFQEDSDDTIIQLRLLKILRLEGLMELEHVWKGPTRFVSLCNLTRVDINRCQKLRFIFSSPSLATSMQRLEILKISWCPNLEEIISRKGGNDDDFSCCCCFTNLRELEVSVCDKVKTILPIAPFHPQSGCRLPKLQSIVLESNKELEHIFGHQTQVECPSLQVMRVRNCPKIATTHFVATQVQEAPSPKPLKADSIDNIQGIEQQLQRRRGDLSQNKIICSSPLKRMELVRCNKLKQVFTTFVTSLRQLEELIVEECDELEQVFSNVEDGKEEHAIVVCFENLKILKVNKCGKLKIIFPISVGLPKLGTLELKSNAEMEHVFGQSDKDYTWQSPSLENLCVVGCPKMCIQWMQNLSTAKEIKTIELGYIQVEEPIQLQSQGNNLLTFPLQTFSLQNVEQLKCIWVGPTRNIWFKNLVRIEVIGCNRLKYIFATAIATSLPMLKKLIVRRCNELEQVMMVGDGKEGKMTDAKAQLIMEVGFENLQVLYVSNCEKLKTIFSIFVPVPNLDCLRLESNVELESLFGESDCDYTSSCDLTYLNELSITGCPNLCTDSIAILRSQLLQAQSTAKIINLSNIQGVEELVQFQRHDDDDVNVEDDDDYDCGEFHGLKLEEVGELKKIWSGPTQNISFSFLVALRVIGCNRLKQVFTTTMASTLHNLQLLSVESCHDLEHVIQEEEPEDEGSDKQSVQQLELSSLEMLNLIDLPKLISFCPTSCNLALSCLPEENLRVEGCPKYITDFFGDQSYKQDKEESIEGEYEAEAKEGEYDANAKEGEDDKAEEEEEEEGYYSRKSIYELFGIPRRSMLLRRLN